jgi:membrane-bound inhibitor of C-type lysozyme
LKLLWLVMAVGVVGCTTVNNSANNNASEIEVAFTCTGGESLAVRFFPNQEKAMLIRNGETIELQQERAASGFRYSNSNKSTTISGKGKDLTVTIGRMTPLECQAKS